MGMRAATAPITAGRVSTTSETGPGLAARPQAPSGYGSASHAARTAPTLTRPPGRGALGDRLKARPAGQQRGHDGGYEGTTRRGPAPPAREPVPTPGPGAPAPDVRAPRSGHPRHLRARRRPRRGR